MIRLILTCLAMFVAVPVLAQTPSVVVKSELSAEKSTVGQPLILRVTVLVPTWMPEPPRFPSMEIPDVIVRLPARASSPTSERVDGETWSGVTRAYRLYPMIPGTFTLAPQTVGITFADPETRAPVAVEVALDPVVFSAVVPDAAKDLDPLILAEDFSLSQELEGPDETLKQGDAVTRTLSAKIRGTSALFIPPLVPAVTGDATRAYSKDPVVKETENRGVLSGSRQDSVTYVAQYGGTLELPQVSFDWYNTKTKKVETVTLEGRSFVIDAPLRPEEPLLTREQIVKLIGGALLLLLILFALKRYVVPVIRQRMDTSRKIWLHSEAYAARQVKQAIGSHDLSQVYRALASWNAKCPGRAGAELEAALALTGAPRFGGREKESGGWAVLSSAFQSDRDRRLNIPSDSDLPPLNGTK